MSMFENNHPTMNASKEGNEEDVSNLMSNMIPGDHLSSACATPDDEEESISEASTTNDDCTGTPGSLPTDESMNTGSLSMTNYTTDTGISITNYTTDTVTSMTNYTTDTNANSMPTISPSKMRRLTNSAGNPMLPNGKKTKGRVKIKMEFIDNKLRRYTTFSKRKTGIMKKALELSTLTGTQVMLLVASETGHVYTFATEKLRPMITSETGKALIQTCLNTPDPTDRPPCTESTAMSANFHTSEIASLTPSSLLFASGVSGNNSNSVQHQRNTTSGASKRAHKSNQVQQRCAKIIQDVTSGHSGGGSASIDGCTTEDLSISSGKGTSKTRYYNSNELPTMVPPKSASRFTGTSSTSSFVSPSLDQAGGEDEDMDGEEGDFATNLSLSGTGNDQHEASDLSNGTTKQRSMFQKHTSFSPPSTASSNGITSMAGSTLNNILHTIVANRQQQRQQMTQTAGATSSMDGQGPPSGQQNHQHRRKRPPVSSAAHHVANKQPNLSGQMSLSQTVSAHASSNAQQLGSQLFPFAGLIPGSNAAGASTAVSQQNSQHPAFGLFPALSNGAFLYPPGIVYTPTPVSLPEGAAAALALQQMLASVVAAASGNTIGDMSKGAIQRAQTPSSSGRNSSPAVQSSQQPMIPLPLSLSMMTANYLAAQQSQRDESDDGAQSHNDDGDSD